MSSPENQGGDPHIIDIIVNSGNGVPTAFSTSSGGGPGMSV